MQIALMKNGKRVSACNANRVEEYFCPLCNGGVILKQGIINVEHFAHKKNVCTDSWHYDMSEWHYSMQVRFSEEQREVVVVYNNEIHRADVLEGKYVIEFQHSLISYEEINARNEFYNSAGYNVAWVFDVREQYDSRQIRITNRDDGTLMYKWNNPKRSLQCFPPPRENRKDLIIYLYWINDEGEEEFNRIIWSSPNVYSTPDFKRFIISEYSIVTESVESKLNVNMFFVTKEDLLMKHLNELGCNFEIKYLKEKGHRRDSYVCPKTNKFGINCYGENGCKYCRYCGAIKKKNVGREVYCCYPNQVNEVTEVYPGYESCGVPEY